MNAVHDRGESWQSAERVGKELHSACIHCQKVVVICCDWGVRSKDPAWVVKGAVFDLVVDRPSCRDCCEYHGHKLAAR